MKLMTKLICTGAVTLLAGCGRSEPDRVQGGAAAGAGQGRPLASLGVL
jgi:hypothetical protein